VVTGHPQTGDRLAGTARFLTESGLMGDGSVGDVRLPYGVRLATAWCWRLIVIAVFLYGVLRLLSHFEVLVVPFLLAVLLVALTRPVTDLLARWVPRGVAALATVFLVIGLVAGLVTLVCTQIASGFPDLEDQASSGLGEVRDWLSSGPLHLTTERLADYVGDLQTSLSSHSGTLVSGAVSAAGTVGDVLAGIFIALFSMYFMLAQGPQIWEWLLRVLPDAAQEPLDVAARRGWVTLTSYVRATVLVAATDALGIGIGAAILGVPLAVPLGVLVFLGAFVPVVGALVSGIVAVLVALVSDGPVTALIMLAIVVAVQQVEAHVLQPFLLGRAVSVHPLAVILGIAAGALTAGIVGALFAVPLIAVGNTVMSSLSGRADAQDPDFASAANPVADDVAADG
jgi:predicted PurR-regulated permease PerM